MSQDDAEIQGDADAVRQELTEMRGRMAAIKEAAAAEVNEKWASPFRTQDVFDLKVKARLSSNEEYRSLQRRVQEAEATLAAEPDAAAEADSAT
ncbi:MAG: hypothetical protein ACRDS9_08985 [Pseudonocardiaceae bacterium]